MVPRVVSWGCVTPVTTARVGPTCSVTSGLKSHSTASYLHNCCHTGAPTPQELQPQGGDRRGLSCYRARAARFEGRDFELLS